MPRTTQGAAAPRVQYPRPSVVQVTARAGGWTERTARQMLNPSDPRNPFVRCAAILEGLIKAGHIQRAEELALRIDMARLAVPPVVTYEMVQDAMEREQVADGGEDVAQLFVRDRASYETWRRRAMDAISDTLTAVRVCDAYYGRQP